MSKGRIVIISLMEGFRWGGSEELWYELAKLLLRHKNQLSLSVKAWENAPRKVLELKNLGANVYFRQANKTPKNFVKRQFYKLGLLLKLLQSDDFAFLKNDNISHVVISLGGPYTIQYFPNLLRHINQLGLSYSIIQQFNTENYVLPNNIRNLNREFYEKSACVFFVSNRNKQTTERNLVVKLTNGMVVNNPVNLKSKQILDYPTFEGRFNFACVARLDAAYKGQDVLIEILSTSIWQKRDWMLNLYGDGPDKQYLEELVAIYGLTDKVVFWGSVEDIESIWAINHLLILPSVSEGKPLALVEAMYCGRASVVTNVGGCSEIVEHGVTGFIAEAPTKNLIGACLEEAWESKENWKEMGIRAHHTVLSQMKVNGANVLEDYINSI